MEPIDHLKDYRAIEAKMRVKPTNHTLYEGLDSVREAQAADRLGSVYKAPRVKMPVEIPAGRKQKPYRKLSVETVQQILDSPDDIKNCAANLGVHRTTVQDILRKHGRSIRRGRPNSRGLTS